MKKLVVLIAAVLGLTVLVPGSAVAQTSCLVGDTGTVRCGDSVARSYNLVLVARLYGGKDYTGRVLRLYRTKSCSTSTSTVEMTVDLSRVDYYGAWDDRVMSFTTHNNCDIRLFDNADGGYTMYPTGWLDHDRDMLINGRSWQRKVDVVRLS
jgi:hypothetical protein